MQKIPALVSIDREAHRPLRAFNPQALARLAAANAILATRKRDGQAMQFLGGDPTEVTSWLIRRAVAAGKPAPAGFILVEEDAVTGKRFGWEPAATASVRKILVQALASFTGTPAPGTTFELCGPKMQGNPEGLANHTLFEHGSEGVAIPISSILNLPAHEAFDALIAAARAWEAAGVEGVVLWVAGAPAVKVRTKDLLPLA